MKITVDPRFTDYVNEHVVPVLGIVNHDEMAPHAPLPDGRCWIFPTMTCEQHRANFHWGLDAIHGFPMSPGHAILTPKIGPVPDRDDFVLVADDSLPDEGTVDSWIAEFKEQQAKLGPAVGAAEYERQRADFATADVAAVLDRIASDPKGLFREEAKLALAGESDPSRMDAVEEEIRSERWTQAIGLIGDTRGPRAEACRQHIERVAWHFLSRARMCARAKDAPGAARFYRRVIDEFPGTESERAARKEVR